MLYEDYINKARRVHGDKYDYSLLGSTIIYGSKIPIICPVHGEFIQNSSNHLRGKGCASCANRQEISTKEFIRRAKEVHGDKYDYSLVSYKNMKSKIDIICLSHGVFSQTPEQHIRLKQGCSVCSGNRRITKQTLEEKFINIYGENLIDLSYIENIKNNSQKIKILCKQCNKFFYKTPSKLLSRGGHYCSYTSKGEMIIENILSKNNIGYIAQYSNAECTNNLDYKKRNRLYFDFFLPKENICIEFQGIQHFTPVEKFGGFDDFLLRIKNDQIKKNYLINNKINLLLINYWEIDKIEEILKGAKII